MICDQVNFFNAFKILEVKNLNLKIKSAMWLFSN